MSSKVTKIQPENLKLNAFIRKKKFSYAFRNLIVFKPWQRYSMEGVWASQLESSMWQMELTFERSCKTILQPLPSNHLTGGHDTEGAVMCFLARTPQIFFFVINNKLTLRVMAVQKFKCDCAYLVEQHRSHAGPGPLPPSASATCKVRQSVTQKKTRIRPTYITFIYPFSYLSLSLHLFKNVETL